jgi:PAS domain S-box-containing protein
LAGFFVLSLITFFATGILALISPPPPEDASNVTALLIAAIAFTFGSVGLLRLNRYSIRLATLLFLLLLTVIFIFSDSPQELSVGRSSFVFIIPITISSLLLFPASSFFFAILNSVIMGVLATLAGTLPSVATIIGFFMLALISWLSSRSMENALKEVRTMNTDLDQRVAVRTQELSEALTREHAETGRRQAILQGIADGVIVFDINGEAILANPAISHMLEIPFEGIVGYTFYDIFLPPQITDDDRLLLSRTMRDLDSTLVPIRIRWNTKTLSVNAAPVRNPQGQPIGKVAVLRDFTHEAEVEQMKNRFIAMVSHELRTPLGAILGYSEMLNEAFYGPLNEKQLNATGRILNNSRRLLEIVNDLLDQAQIEVGHLTFHITNFNPKELAENLFSVMEKIANDKGLELKSEIAADMPETLRGDTHRLQQILINLVNNAVKFTASGSVSVHIYTVDEQNWGFDVTDTGPGIAPENQKSIFDPYRQVDGTSTRLHGGIGLGLAIVQKLVDLMGGHILVKSELGKGSTFTVILPYQPPEQKEQA